MTQPHDPHASLRAGLREFARRHDRQIRAERAAPRQADRDAFKALREFARRARTA